MKPTITTRELPDGMEFAVCSRPAIFGAAASGLIIGIVVYLVGSALLRWYALILALVTAVLGFVIAGRTQTAHLHARNLDFTTTSAIGGDGRQPWVVSRAEIRSMYFDREHGGGDDGPYYPAGLYADVGSREASLLPFVGEEQSLQVIADIYKRFPDMPINDDASPFDKHFTILKV